MLYMIYADIEVLIKKTDKCKNDLEKLSTTKMGNLFLADIQCQ